MKVDDVRGGITQSPVKRRGVCHPLLKGGFWFINFMLGLGLLKKITKMRGDMS